MNASHSIDLADARRRLLGSAASERFDPAELEVLPEPVRRYFNAAITPGSPVATSATLTMRGHIRIGRWLPFRADEVLAPSRGFVWRARAAGVISGFDAYVDGHGAMQWKLFGRADVMHRDGEDVTRSAAGRCVGEGIWVPTALLPRFGVSWTAPATDHIVAAWELDGTRVKLHCRVDADGHLTPWCSTVGAIPTRPAPTAGIRSAVTSVTTGRSTA
jgi:hypothetical protein